MSQFNGNAGLRPTVFISSNERRKSVIETVERPVPDYSASRDQSKLRANGVLPHMRVSSQDIEDAVTRGGEAGGRRIGPHGFVPAALVDLNGRGLHAIVYRMEDGQYGIDLYRTRNGETQIMLGASYVAGSRAIAERINRLIDADPPDFKLMFSSPAGIPGRPLKIEANLYSLPDGYTPPERSQSPVKPEPALKVLTPA